MKYIKYLLIIFIVKSCFIPEVDKNKGSDTLIKVFYRSDDNNLDLVLRNPFPKGILNKEYSLIKANDSIELKATSYLLLLVGQRGDFLDTVILYPGDQITYSYESPNNYKVNSLPSEMENRKSQYNKYKVMIESELINSVKDLTIPIPKNMEKAEIVFANDFSRTKYIGVPYNLDKKKYVKKQMRYDQQLERTYNSLDSVIWFNEEIEMKEILSSFLLDYYNGIANHLKSKSLNIFQYNKIKDQSSKSDTFYFNDLHLRTFINGALLNYDNVFNYNAFKIMLNDTALMVSADFKNTLKSTLILRLLESNENPLMYKKEIYKVLEYIQDTALQKYVDNRLVELENDYLLKNTISDDLLYSGITINDPKITFKELIEENAGKLILIDIWASWCFPCRENLPKVLNIQQRYEPEELITMFISIDRHIHQWNAARLKEKIVMNSYYIPNFEKSKIKGKFNIKYIPRYILYNKKGDLINKDIKIEDLEGFINEALNI